MSAEISGTWDFKWPQGSAIRVAFQNLPERDVGLMPPIEKIIYKYREAAERWLANKPNIGFEWVNTRLPAPGIFGDHQNLRSPREGAHVEYDVLVSFASTPAKVVADRAADETHITGQLSVLGSYARRINYGTPTTVVGPNRDFIPEGKQLGDYFDDPFFEEIVVHEVGHVLGIPHQHQNPLYARPPLKTPKQIEDELVGIRRVYWTKFAPPIDSEIRKVWPGVENKRRSANFDPKSPLVFFSDWGPIENTSKPLELQTVMAHPIWSRLTEAKLSARELTEVKQPRTQPFPFDLELLQRMYPQR